MGYFHRIVMSTIKQTLNIFLKKIKEIISSSRGKDSFLFLSFLGISYVFWLMLTLNNEIQEDFDVPFEITNVPDSVTMIDNLPSKINVSVREKGSSLIRYRWGNVPKLKVRFKDFSSEGKFILGKSEIDSKLRSYFGGNTQIISFSPDSIKTTYTSQKGRKVKLRINADVSSNFQYIINGAITADTDSVLIFASEKYPNDIDCVETLPIVKHELKDSFTIVVDVKKISGIRIIPDKVTVTIPVEPLISKKRNIAIKAVNVPASTRLITFPSSVEIDYLVPMSMYHSETEDINISVDYMATKNGEKKLPIILSNMPDIFHNISISPDSVEYIIEQL